MAAYYPPGRHLENGLGLHYTRFLPIGSLSFSYLSHLKLNNAPPIGQDGLAGLDFAPALRWHFKHELENWLDEIQRIRLKPTSITGSFRLYFDRNPEYSGDSGFHLVLLRQHQPTKSAEELVDWLKEFHTRLESGFIMGSRSSR